ncbi:inorganic phosphate transporter [Calothrix sp. 336/3]|uniref:inorganic phosphate transporter n=1 Tax=Calothrix sp. 336/3 TaxID=1337936 RepID=UPI0004E30656|nr:inorganic phosphate transporter [Calothrix sp. 336/3]
MFIAIAILLAFYLAFNLGANDVANAMGTSVGSKAVTLRQALVIAGILEFTGAVLFGHEVSQTLATKIVNPEFFVDTPEILVAGMVTVLLSCGLWLQIATFWGLPVSSSHAVVGAIAGFSWVAIGIQGVDWLSIGKITIGWLVTPLISGAIAAVIYSQIRWWILEQKQQIIQLNEWIPWLSAAILSIFGVIALPAVTQPLTDLLLVKLGVQLPAHDIPLLVGSIAVIGLTVYGWRQVEHQNANPVEHLFGKLQLLSACFVAFAHGSNDVGNAIAPLAAIIYIHNTHTVPLNHLTIPLWILVTGGVGIVAGLAILGKKVISTIGENIIPLQPSAGFCAELATATTILLASRIGLPLSTSHALVGGVVGIGLVQNYKAIKVQTLQGIATAWLVTIPISAGISAIGFKIWLILH